MGARAFKSRGSQICEFRIARGSCGSLVYSRRMIEVFVLLDDYSLWDRLPSFHIVACAQKRSSRCDG